MIQVYVDYTSERMTIHRRAGCKGAEKMSAPDQRVIKIDDRYDYYLALNKNTEDEIVSQLQRSLEVMKKDGSYEKIRQAYLR